MILLNPLPSHNSGMDDIMTTGIVDGLLLGDGSGLGGAKKHLDDDDEDDIDMILRVMDEVMEIVDSTINMDDDVDYDF